MNEPVHKQTPEEFRERMDDIHGTGGFASSAHKVPGDVRAMRSIAFELQEAALCYDDAHETAAWQHVEKARMIARNYLNTEES